MAATDRFGDYVVDGVVGHGGSATVYRAHHSSDAEQTLALKVPDVRDREPARLDRLRREFDFANRLGHPHVIRMYEYGTSWLAMELIEGGAVSNLSSMTDRLAALAYIAGALDHAHRQGVVHCDVKPANILAHRDFSDRGAVLIDFGAAHSVAEDVHHRPRHVEASLPYTAPEMLEGRAPTAASDEYALACTTIELLIGTTPYTADSAMDLVDAHLNSPVPRYSRRFDWISHVFDSILAKAMAKEPDLRYASCEEFVTLATRALT